MVRTRTVAGVIRIGHVVPRELSRQVAPSPWRHSRKLGTARLAGIVDVPASTVHRALVRHSGGLKSSSQHRLVGGSGGARRRLRQGPPAEGPASTS